MAHSPKKKAAVVHDLITGMTVRDAAEKHGIPDGTVLMWSSELSSNQNQSETTLLPVTVQARIAEFETELYGLLSCTVAMVKKWTEVCAETDFIKSNPEGVNGLGKTALDFADRIVARTGSQASGPDVHPAN